jgi:hypothetical protein
VTLDSAVRFNPTPHIQTVTLSDGQKCYVIDDALVEPERLVDFAVAEASGFRNVDFNAFPGVFLRSPAALESMLASFFGLHLRSRFDARRLQQMHCRLSMVSLAPERLRPYQCLCHRDVPALDPRHSIQATILYLFRDATLGGTSFYEPIRPPEDIARLFDDATRLPSEEFWDRYALRPGYMLESNAWFRRTGSIEARWNRLICYDGYALHSGNVSAPDRLTTDPSTGRLTLNGFFTSTRNTT